MAFDYQRELMHEGRPITLDNMRAKWYNLSLEKMVMLMQVFAQHSEQMKALVNKEFAPLTLERYETSFRHTQAFMKWKYKIDDIDVSKLKYEFVTDYEFWIEVGSQLRSQYIDEVLVYLQEDRSHLY